MQVNMLEAKAQLSRLVEACARRQRAQNHGEGSRQGHNEGQVTRYLLDTHVVLWALTEPRSLSPATRAILDHESVYVSAVSVWEALPKQARRRLRLPEGSLIQAIQSAGAKFLPLLPDHAESAASLGLMHGDPMDRLLIGSARVEKMILLARDAQILERAAPALGGLLMEA